MPINEYSNKRLLIAYLGHKKVPSRLGGIEIVVEELATRMAEKGHLVTCYNRSSHSMIGVGYNKKESKYKGITLKEVPTINRKGLAAVSSSVFASFAVTFRKYDVVHFHAEGPALLCWLPKIMGRRVIVTIHGLDWQRAKWGRFASWYIKTGEKNAAKYADEIIVLSKGVQQYFWKNYGRKTHFIPNGVTRHKVVAAEEIKKWGLKKDEYVLFLGRIVPEKGEKYLIEAFRSVNTDKKLVIAGGSSDTDDFLSELKNMAKGDTRIVFTGFVQGKTLDELYSNAYVYCLPSDLEGMPLSLLEAMSYGNCCLTSDIAECSEVVEDKAVTFRKGDVSDLKSKLEWLLNHEHEVRKYKNEAAAFITAKYNWNDVADRTLELYREK